MKTHKKRVAVLFGGKSPEHEVSIITGIQVIENLDHALFDVLPIYIAKDGRWYSDPELAKIETYRNLQIIPEKNSRQTVSLDTEHKGIVQVSKKSLNPFNKSTDKDIDVLFPAFHGGIGENGGISGLFEIMDIPYVGPGVTGGALGMDKIVMKQVLEQAGVNIAKWTWFYRNEWQRDFPAVLKKIEKKLHYPLFIKPASGGSSIGTSKAQDKKELERAIEVAAVFDSKIVVEESIEDAREINISVLGNAGSELQFSLCEEVFTDNNLLTYEDKYLGEENKVGPKTQGMASTKRKIPAEIPQDAALKIKEIAKIVFESLNASGVSRIDFLYQEKTKLIYVIEINTIPGSLAFYLWEPSGLTFKELLGKLISLAVERFEENRKNTTTFSTNILENFDANKGAKMKL